MSKIIPRQEPLHIAASPIESPEAMSPHSTTSSSDFAKPSSIIVTSKEWVLPPRPKPGRKPSPDTPASKRKAQNRAAQRAFRERRATRVQELEEKLLEVEKEREAKELGFISTINKLRTENQFLIKNIEKLRSDVYLLRNSSNAPTPPNSNSGSVNSTSSHNSNMNGNALGRTPLSLSIASASLQSHSSPRHMHSASNSPAPSMASPGGSIIQQQISPAPSGNSPPAFIADRLSQTTTILEDDCGVCIKEECLCEAVGLKEVKIPPPVALEETINSFKPMAAVSLKKRKATSLDIEIDFTKKFTIKKPMPDLSKLVKKKAVAKRNNNEFMESQRRKTEEFNEASPVENCGFCTDDTPCVCREAAKEAANINTTLNNDILQDDELKDEVGTSLPPILNSNSFRKTSLPVMHPGPSVEIRDIANLSPGAVPNVVGPSSRQPAQSSLVELAAAAEASTPTPQPQTPSASTFSSGGRESTSEPSGCTGNPGTCGQCQMDPMSTLFCTTVANIGKRESAVRDLQQKEQELEKKKQLEEEKKLKEQAQQESGMFIPCSDAYKTLSRHKKFSSVDFSTLVGKLTTRGMQVEVQSVANVLRELDRRLYN